jgi:hypothetical protein
VLARAALRRLPALATLRGIEKDQYVEKRKTEKVKKEEKENEMRK